MTETKPIGTSEAAALLRVSRPTITRMAQSGKITPLHKANGQRGAYVFDASEVERVAQDRQR